MCPKESIQQRKRQGAKEKRKERATPKKETKKKASGNQIWAPYNLLDLHFGKAKSSLILIYLGKETTLSDVFGVRFERLGTIWKA